MLTELNKREEDVVGFRFRLRGINENDRITLYQDAGNNAWPSLAHWPPGRKRRKKERKRELVE